MLSHAVGVVKPGFQNVHTPQLLRIVGGECGGRGDSMRSLRGASRSSSAFPIELQQEWPTITIRPWQTKYTVLERAHQPVPEHTSHSFDLSGVPGFTSVAAAAARTIVWRSLTFVAARCGHGQISGSLPRFDAFVILCILFGDH